MSMRCVHTESNQFASPLMSTKLQIYSICRDVMQIKYSFTYAVPPFFLLAVEVLQPQPHDIIDFMLETTTSGSEAIGVFPETPVAYGSRADGAVEQLVTSDRDGVDANRNSNKIEQSANDQNDCERNVVYRKFSVSDDKVTLNWTTGDVALPSENNFVNFR
jgi:hypothetical protein